MLVQDIMSKDVEVLNPRATVVEAARKMRDLDVGMMPVCDGEKIQGVITDRDIVINVIAEGKDCRSVAVQDCIQGSPKWVYADSDVDEAARLMEDEQIRRLIVVDRNKKLVGVLSLGDIATRGDEDMAGNALEEISQPTMHNH
jgi:CBS domain-containing protein